MVAITFRSVLALVVIFCIHTKVSLGEGNVTVRFISYENENHRMSNGRCCENGLESCRELPSGCVNCTLECDNLFYITLDQKLKNNITNYGTVRTNVIAYNDKFKFGNNLTYTIMNPLIFTVDSYEGMFTLRTESHDEDERSVDFVDGFRFSFNATSLPAGGYNQSNKFQTQLKGNVSVLDIEIWVSCAPDFYGPHCTRFCVATDDATGHYTCDENGNIKCLLGWRNETKNCTERYLMSSLIRTSISHTSSVLLATNQVQSTTTAMLHVTKLSTQSTQSSVVQINSLSSTASVAPSTSTTTAMLHATKLSTQSTQSSIVQINSLSSTASVAPSTSSSATKINCTTNTTVQFTVTMNGDFSQVTSNNFNSIFQEVVSNEVNVGCLQSKSSSMKRLTRSDVVLSKQNFTASSVQLTVTITAVHSCTLNFSSCVSEVVFESYSLHTELKVDNVEVCAKKSSCKSGATKRNNDKKKSKKLSTTVIVIICLALSFALIAASIAYVFLKKRKPAKVDIETKDNQLLSEKYEKLENENHSEEAKDSQL